MPIGPPKGITIELEPASPSLLDAASLKVQLENIGLDCAQLTPSFLNQQVTEVTSQLPSGTVQSFGILAPTGSVAPSTMPESLATLAVRRQNSPLFRSTAASLAAVVGETEPVATGNWTELDSAQGYQANLMAIMYSSHFDWLMEQQATNSFPGVRDLPPVYSGDYPNAAAIRTLFINSATSASSTVVAGIDHDTMQAVFSNVIQPLTDANISNYNQPGSRVIMLAENYNTQTRTCDAIGAVTVEWNLTITDYQRKSKDGGDTHPTTLTVKSRSALYADTTVLCQNYQAVVQQFQIQNAPPCPAG